MIDSAETPPGGQGSGQSQSEGDKYRDEAWYKQQKQEQETMQRRAQEIIEEQRRMREQAQKNQHKPKSP